MDTRAGRMPLVDSLRAIAALSVLAFHALGIFGGLLGPRVVLRPFVARLEVGVVIFLAISGFLLYRPFVYAHLRAGPAPSTGAYAWRRFLRIAPAYWVALAISAAVVPFAGVLSLHGLLSYFGFLQIYRSSTIGLGDSPTWTLGLEISFYALLPLWAWLLRRTACRARTPLRAEWIGVALLIIGSLVFKALLFATGAVPARIPTSPLPALVTLPGYLDEFAVGMGLAVLSVWLEERVHPRWLARVDRWPGLAWLFAAAMFVLVSVGVGLSGNPAQRFSPLQYEIRSVLYGLIALGLLLPAVFGDVRRGAVRRLLGHRVLMWLGLVSYGLYLWHWPVLVRLAGWGYGSVAPGLARYALWGTLPVVGAVALGALSYYAVERPALSLRRLAPGRGAPIGQAATRARPGLPSTPVSAAEGQYGQGPER